MKKLQIIVIVALLIAAGGISVSAQPTAAAPTPTPTQANVKSVFSDHYTQYAKFEYEVSDWSSAKSTKSIIYPLTTDPADRILEINGLNNGVEALISLGGGCDWSDRDYVHIDIFSPAGNQGIGEFDFALLSNFSGSQKMQADVWIDITAQNLHGQWIPIDVPISKFEGGSLQLNKISNLVIRRGAKGSTGALLYVDNIYAYCGSGTPVVNSVTISGSAWIQRSGTPQYSTAQYSAKVSGLNNPSQNVTWTLSGAENPATTLSATGLLTVATEEPANTLSITATSVEDPEKSATGAVTLINPPTMRADNSVDLTSTLPHCPAPTPAHDPDDVRALFSDAYPYDASKFLLTYDDWLGAGATACVKEIITPFTDLDTETLLHLDPLYSNNQAQISLGTTNLVGMDSIHIDIYSPGSDQGIGEFDFGLVFNWSGGNHVAANIWLNVTSADLHGRWISFDLPISRFVAFNSGFQPNNVNIIRLRRGGQGSKGAKLYVDNIYAYATGSKRGYGSGGNGPDITNPEEITPTTIPADFTLNSDDVIPIFCEQYEAPDYQANLGIWDVSGDYTMEDDYTVAKMNYGQNPAQNREFVEIIPESGNRQIHLTGWSDYPFKVHKNSTTMDLSDMDYLHFSVFQSGELDLSNKSVSVTLLMHDNADHGVTSDVAFVTAIHGEWTSVSIPLCYYREKLDLENVYVLRVRVGGYNSQDIYVDNIFAYRGEPFEGTSVAAPCQVTGPPDGPIADKTDGTLPPAGQSYLGVNLASASGGTNPGRYGWEYKMPSFDDLYYFKAKGIRLIRLPFRWLRVQSELGGELTENDMTEMKKVVKEAERLGMWILFDMHDYCEYSGFEGELYEIGGPRHKSWNLNSSSWSGWQNDAEVTVTAQHYADVWMKLVRTFKDCSNIWGYDLMNEPKDIHIDTLRSIYQTVIDSIRTIDTKTAIVVEGKNYANAPGWEGLSGALKNLTDPIGNNIIYEAHTYFDRDNSGTYRYEYDYEVGQNFDIYKSRLDPFINWCKANGKKGMLGEFGVPYNGASHSDARYMVLIDSVFSYLKQKQLTATYWCGGAVYEDYQLTVQPAKNFATEKSTMLVMEKYTRNFDALTGLDPVLAGNSQVSVYPNPVSDELHIDAGSRLIRQVRVYNLLGQTVKTVEPISRAYTLDFRQLTPGNYIVIVTLDDNTVFVQKIIKQ